MLKTCAENVRKKLPLIHCITNYVTVNDCANVLLACGGSPIMTDDVGEVEEITALSNGLAINIGTMGSAVAGMLLAGKKANALGRPVTLDPVGVGASKLRTETVRKLLEQVRFTVIRGNISEMKALALGSGTTRGVDADAADVVTGENLSHTIGFAKELAGRTGAVIVMTGAVDIVASAEKAYTIRNGHPMLSRITGSGCMLTAMTAAYVAANPGNVLEAAVTSACAMGVCGEKAYRQMEKTDSGNASYRNYLIDAVYKLDGDTLKEEARYELW